MKKIFFDLQRFADIYNAESNTPVSGTSDNDSIYNEWNDNVTIDAGDGSDTISNYNGSNVSISAGAGNDEIDNNGGDSVTINAGDGNDYIRNYNSNVTIEAGVGKDTIENWYGAVYEPNYGGAYLTALTLGSITLTPAFNAGTLSYMASTSNATNTVTATPADGATAVIKVNGSTVQSGSSVSWTTGSNTVTVTVTKGSSTKTYTVTVTKGA